MSKLDRFGIGSTNEVNDEGTKIMNGTVDIESVCSSLKYIADFLESNKDVWTTVPGGDAEVFIKGLRHQHESLKIINGIDQNFSTAVRDYSSVVEIKSSKLGGN